jgi:putative transcriptional regulator
MPLIYKIDVLQSLKDKGYNTTKMRREKLLAEGSIQSLREPTICSRTDST